MEFWDELRDESALTLIEALTDVEFLRKDEVVRIASYYLIGIELKEPVFSETL